ncbi:hypothetical protein Ndes2526B_g00362 [Nannochloris sp. 'desiccata']
MSEPRCSTVVVWTTTEFEAAMKDDIEEETCVSKSEIDAAMSKMLRIMLGDSNNQPIIQSTLRSKALAGAESDLSKYVIELALLSLVDQGLLNRHGYGNFALYTIPQDALHEATKLAYLEFSTEDSAIYSSQQHLQLNQQQQPPILGYVPPLPITAPPCSIYHPASPRPRSGRSHSTEKLSSVIHRVRLNGKRGHNSINSLNNIEESQLTGGSGMVRETREKRARIGRPPECQSQSLLHVGGSNNGPAPMSP